MKKKKKKGIDNVMLSSSLWLDNYSKNHLNLARLTSQGSQLGFMF